MKLRKLKYGCEHVDEMHPYGYYVEHEVAAGGYDKHPHYSPSWVICPGGVFLPDDTLVIEKVGEKCEMCGGVGTTYATYVDSDGALIVAVGKAPSQCGTCRGTGMVSYLDELLDRIGQAATVAVPRLLPHEADEIAIATLDTLFVREAE